MHSPFRQGLNVYPDAASLARGAARLFAGSLEKAIREKGVFSVVLSGGETPSLLYRLLSTEEYGTLQWQKVHLFWGDERCVPPESSESNFNSARENLLSRIDIPQENIHRIKGELAPDLSAASYQEELVTFFGLGAPEPPPFDLVLLGLGTDGHTLSLFPGTRALFEEDKLVVPNFVPALDSWRVTLTLKALRRAQRAVFLVSGAPKAAVLKEVFDGAALPAAMARAKEVLWLADSEAASLVKS